MSAKKVASPALLTFLTVEQVASTLMHDPSTVRRMCAGGNLPGAFQSGEPGHESSWRIPPEALTAYVRARQEAAQGKAPTKRRRG